MERSPVPVAGNEIQAQAGALNVERVVIEGDLSNLTPAERLAYYRQTCDSLGLNWHTKPFEYLRLNGRLVLYATRAAADQLRKIHGISIEIVSQRMDEDGLYIVHVRARDAEGRTDEEMGVVPLVKTVEDKRNPGEFRTFELKGEELANAIMKAVTKAKRRVTLSIAGLGWLDETEVDSIPDARRVPMEEAMPTVEVEQPAPPPAPAPAPAPRKAADWSGWDEVERAEVVKAMKERGLTPRELLGLLYVDAETMAKVNDDPSIWPQVVLGVMPTVGGITGLMEIILTSGSEGGDEL